MLARERLRLLATFGLVSRHFEQIGQQVQLVLAGLFGELVGEVPDVGRRLKPARLANDCEFGLFDM